MAGDVEITLVPARPWSMRTPWNRNDALWGGFVYRAREGVAYHSGDTALFDEFTEIGRRVGPVDWAMLPIGAYEPRWFMEPQHMNPEDAAEAFVRLGARAFCAMHWGTFKLTDEPEDRGIKGPLSHSRCRCADKGDSVNFPEGPLEPDLPAWGTVAPPRRPQRLSRFQQSRIDTPGGVRDDQHLLEERAHEDDGDLRRVLDAKHRHLQCPERRRRQVTKELDEGLRQARHRRQRAGQDP